jgi:hypothetical protein
MLTFIIKYIFTSLIHFNLTSTKVEVPTLVHLLLPKWTVYFVARAKDIPIPFLLDLSETLDITDLSLLEITFPCSSYLVDYLFLIWQLLL